TEGSAAEKAGIQQGDIVVSVGDKKIQSSGDVQEALRNLKVGDKVKARFTHEGKPLEAELVVQQRPAQQRGGPGGGRRGADPQRPYSAQLGGQEANVQDEQGADGYQYGGVYRSTDGGESWTRINTINPRPMYFSEIRVDPSDDQILWVLGVSLSRSTDGGKTFRTSGRGVHADQHAMWIDPKDGRHMLVGCDGGTYVTYDRGANWDHLNHAAIGQFYHVALDTRPNYRVYGGLQDNG